MGLVAPHDAVAICPVILPRAAEEDKRASIKQTKRLPNATCPDHNIICLWLKRLQLLTEGCFAGSSVFERDHVKPDYLQNKGVACLKCCQQSLGLAGEYA